MPTACCARASVWRAASRWPLIRYPIAYLVPLRDIPVRAPRAAIENVLTSSMAPPSIEHLHQTDHVIYAGAIVEQAAVEAVFTRPAHPYTEALLRATPTMCAVQDELLSIPGQIPSPLEVPTGCHFAARCAHGFERGATEPLHIPVEAEHTACCWLLERDRG